MRRARMRQRIPPLSVLSTALFVLTSCAVSAQVVAPGADVETPTPTPGIAIATPTPVTPTPLPTAPPTPTPTPAPLFPTELLELAIDGGFGALSELGLDYSFVLGSEDGALFDSRNADLELLPASNQKLITAIGALELLPADFHFETEVRLSADLDVSIVAGGDPTLTSADIDALARDLVDLLAVESPRFEPTAEDPVPDELPKVVVGDLVVDVSHFPPTRTGPGWLDRYVPADVGPMSSLMIDNNQHRGDLDYLADPDLGNALLIADIFEAAGVEVSGDVIVGPVDPATALVATKQSDQRDELVEAVLARSDNEVADALLREIGLQLGGEGEIPIGQAFVFEQIASLGLDLGAPVGDGSGLSRDARLSAAELVEVLWLARNQDWWPTMDEALEQANVDDALAARLGVDTPVGRVRAKTGTLDDVRALSGILTTLDGQDLMFSFLVNGEAADDGVELMDRIILVLASSTHAQVAG